jgi:hypothetical protein
MRAIITLLVAARGRGHLHVFRAFADALARVFPRHHGEARVRVVKD